MDTARLYETGDAGHRWYPLDDPCPRRLHVWMLASLASSSRGWFLCQGEPGVGQQEKELFETLDGGRSWLPRRLPLGWAWSGYGVAIAFRSSGRGWLGFERNLAIETADGGRTWRRLDVEIQVGDDSAGSLSLVSDVSGFVLLNDNVLLVTHDAGRHWRVVHRWR